jgi:hypothetical protein
MTVLLTVYQLERPQRVQTIMTFTQNVFRFKLIGRHRVQR